MPLILEPQNWERAKLLEFAEHQHENLAGILSAIESGGVVAPDPGRRESAIELLKTVLALYEASRGPARAELPLAAFVNLQYQTMLTVTVLVPPTLLAERWKKAQLLRASG